MTEAQHALILKHQANTPSNYHHIINHLVLTNQLTAASMLVATLEQEQAKPKEAAMKFELKTLKSDIRYVQDKLTTAQEETRLAYMQAEGFRVRMEQLLTENAKLKTLV
ncbi:MULTISPECIES: hypothetical protein [unclassified Pseudomonas]|uniref:hypothetical protein n=1 Tax=unclassified Pseudomonas TaxID=196821 RepID=UPI0039B76840